MDRKITFVVFSLLMSFFFGGCNRPPSITQLQVQLPNEPISLDPTLALDGVSFQVLNNIAEGLMGYSSDGVLGNRLAASYEISKDGKKYSFRLRDGVRWSDGKPILAQDFVVAFRRMLNPDSRSYLAPIYFGIKNAKAFHEARVNEKNLGVRDENGTVIIELEKKIPSFLHSLTLPVTFPLRKDILDANAGNWPESAPASGPYQIKTHKFEQSILLERNLQYRGSSEFISQVEYKITDESTGMNLFDQGMLDIVTRVSALDLPRLDAKGQIKVSPFLATYYLSFNCRKPPFNDKIFRRAVAGSIKRSELVQILGGGELPAWSWIPKGLEGYISYKDPALVFADAILEMNKRKSNPTSIEASFDISSRNSRIMEKVQQDIRKQLNVNLSLSALSWKAFHNLIHSDPSPIFRYGWVAPFMDPITHLKVFTTGNLNNFSGFSNLKYDELVQEIESLSPGLEREDKIFAAQHILLEEEAVVIPIYHYVQHTAVSCRVKEFKINSFGIIQFKDIKMQNICK